MEKIITIATDFSAKPGGRYPADGPGNGTTFREDILVPALNDSEKVRVDLNGCHGFPSSFLEEAFGGLVRNHKFTPDFLKSKLGFIASEEFKFYVEKIWDFVNSAHNNK